MGENLAKIRVQFIIQNSNSCYIFVKNKIKFKSYSIWWDNLGIIVLNYDDFDEVINIKVRIFFLFNSQQFITKKSKGFLKTILFRENFKLLY